MPETIPPPGNQAQQGHQIQLTPDLVQKIAARVYALMLADVRIERERTRFSNQKTPGTNGGRHAA